MRACTYCGDPADHRDHVIPCCTTGIRFFDKNWVWACRHCNCAILRDKPILGFDDRLDEVIKWLNSVVQNQIEFQIGPEMAPETASFALRLDFAKNVMRNLSR